MEHVNSSSSFIVRQRTAFEINLMLIKNLVKPLILDIQLISYDILVFLNHNFSSMSSQTPATGLENKKKPWKNFFNFSAS